MESAFAALPELDVGGREFIAAPEIGTGNFVFIGELRFEFCFSRFEGGTIRNACRLAFRYPRSDLGIVGAGLEVFLGDPAGGFFDGAADTDLAFEFLPKNGHGSVGVFGEVAGFLRVVVGEKLEFFIDDALEEKGAGGDEAFLVGGRDGHGV